MNWSQMKAEVEAQLDRDPQRATLSTKAWQAVEAGLSHLASVGYSFEIAPRGTLAELTQVKEVQLPLPLSIKDAVEQIQGKKKPEMVSKFEAMTNA